jgi:hypothetical protein
MVATAKSLIGPESKDVAVVFLESLFASESIVLHSVLLSVKYLQDFE